jgi:F-type H+-transporting ATPase subunit b
MHINATLLGQMITFAIFVAFTMHFIWPLLQEKMQQRAKFIADSLAAAELRNSQLINTEAEIKALVQAAHAKSNQIIEDAYKESHKILDIARKQAFHDSQVIIENAHGQIEILLAQSKAVLQQELAGLIVLGVGKIINKTVSANDHLEIIDDLIKRLA